MRTSIAFLLGVLLLLSFCPIRKNIYSFLNGDPNPIENKAEGINKHIIFSEQETSMDCAVPANIILNSTDAKAKASLSAQLAVLASILPQSIFTAAKNSTEGILGMPTNRLFKSVPLYIKNRILLI